MRDAHGEIAGRETEALDALGIAWRKAATGSVKMRCPFPDHEDKNPSWRWDAKGRHWLCTCGTGTVFDAAIRMGKAKDWRASVSWVRGALALVDAEVVEPVHFATGAGVSPFLDEPGELAASAHVLADQRPDAAQVTHAKFGKPTRIDCYMVGAKVYEARVRYDTAEGKAVLPWHYNGKRWVNSAAPQPRPLYRVGELLAAPDVPVLVVEGEKAVDAGCELFPDHVVTTTSGGCKQAHHTDFTPLAGRRVTVWPDNDEPGRKYAQEICRLVMAAGALSAHVVAVPPDWPKAWDLADELPEVAEAAKAYAEARGKTVLRAMLDEAVAYVPPVEPERKPAFVVDEDVATEVEQEFEFHEKTGLPLKNEHNVCAALARMGVSSGKLV